MSSARRLVSVLSAILVLCIAPGRAHAQSHAQLVWNQLQTSHTTLTKDGYGVTRYLVGALNTDRADTSRHGVG